MKITDFRKSLNQVNVERKFLGILVALSIIAIIFLAVQLGAKDQKIVIAPYTLSEEGWVSRDNASREYKEAMGLFFAELLGNVSPENIGFIRDRIEPILTSRIRQDVMTTLATQAETIKSESVSISFTPRSLIYEKETDKVFVSGSTRTEGPSGGSTDEQRTYEFRFVINKYLPQLADIDNYPGRAQTVEFKRLRSKQGRK